MSNLVLLVTARDGNIDDPPVAAAGQALTDELEAEDGVDDVVSYWSEGNAEPLRNERGTRALVVARIEGADDQVEDRIVELGPRYEREAAADGCGPSRSPPPSSPCCSSSAPRSSGST